MAFESIPLSWEMLSLLVGAGCTGAGGAWQIARALHGGAVKGIEARFSAAEHRSTNLGMELEKKSIEAESFLGRNREHERHIEKLKEEIKRGLDTISAETLEELERRLRKFNELRDALLGAEDEVWKLRKTQPPVNFAERMSGSKTRVLTVINYKGGVGKTTIVAGLAAYFAKRKKRVLVIDFDYQGSLTRTLILGARIPRGIYIEADRVIGGGAMTGPELIALSRDLGSVLPDARLITCGHSFDGFEYRTMLRWLLGDTDDDVRFRLANLVLSDAVQKRFDYVLIDAPPRASAGAINALCASHAVVIPTVLDALSVDATASFLARVNASFRSLNPGLMFAGVVPTLTKKSNLNDAEERALDDAHAKLPLWEGHSHIFTNRLRHFTALSRAAGRDIGYLTDRAVRQAFDKLGDELVGELNEDKAASGERSMYGSHLQGGGMGRESGVAAGL